MRSRTLPPQLFANSAHSLLHERAAVEMFSVLRHYARQYALECLAPPPKWRSPEA